MEEEDSEDITNTEQKQSGKVWPRKEQKQTLTHSLAQEVNLEYGASAPDDVKLRDLWFGANHAAGSRASIKTRQEYPNQEWLAVLSKIDSLNRMAITKALGAIIRNREVSTLGELREVDLSKLYSLNQVGRKGLIFLKTAFSPQLEQK